MSPDAIVGIVLVSHSTALAEGAAELAAQSHRGTLANNPARSTDSGPAGAVAVAAATFSSAVSLTVGASRAAATSVLGVMGLGATSGQHVTVVAEGPDAEEAVATIVAILAEATRVGA